MEKGKIKTDNYDFILNNGVFTIKDKEGRNLLTIQEEEEDIGYVVDSLDDNVEYFIDKTEIMLFAHLRDSNIDDLRIGDIKRCIALSPEYQERVSGLLRNVLYYRCKNIKDTYSVILDNGDTTIVNISSLDINAINYSKNFSEMKLQDIFRFILTARTVI